MERARAEVLAVSAVLEDEDLDWQEVLDRIDSMDRVCPSPHVS